MKAPGGSEAAAQRVVAEVLAAIAEPVRIHGHYHTRFACCEAPKYALEWSIAEAEVARRAWRRLAEEGVIPRGWLDDPSRRFACPVCFRRQRGAARAGGPRGASCVLCQGVSLEAPSTLVECVTHASDPPALLAAEALVVELAEALAPWGARRPGVIVWRVRSSARAATLSSLRRAWATAALALRRPGEAPARIDTAVAGRAAWRAAVAAKAVAGEGAGDSLRGVRFTELVDPCALFDEIAARGYALEALSETHAVLRAAPRSLGGPGFGSKVLLTRHGVARRGARGHGGHG